MKCTNIEWNNHSNNHSIIKIANGAIRTQIRTNYHLSKEYPTAFPMKLGGYNKPTPNGIWITTP